MGVSILPIAIFTVFWGVVGIVCPFFAPKGPNRGIIQVVLMLTAATCWLFWLCAYMAQMNPLIGPRLSNETLIWISRTWHEPAREDLQQELRMKLCRYSLPTILGEASGRDTFLEYASKIARVAIARNRATDRDA